MFDIVTLEQEFIGALRSLDHPEYVEGGVAIPGPYRPPLPPTTENSVTHLTFKKSLVKAKIKLSKAQILLSKSKGKGKAVPLQAWSGPEGSRKLRFPDFVTTAQDCGKFVSLTHRSPLPPGNAPGTYFC